MTFRDAVGEKIKRTAKMRGLTYHEVAWMAGITERTVIRIIKGEHMGANAIEKISYALCIDWSWK